METQKKNQRPYFRTQANTMEVMKENVIKMNPMSATYKDAGGILNIQSSGEVCRDRTHMKRYKASLTSNCF